MVICMPPRDVCRERASERGREGGGEGERERGLGGLTPPPYICIEGIYIYMYIRLNPVVTTWPLHDIVIINLVWCMAYKRGVDGAL